MIAAPQPVTEDALRPCSQLVYRERKSAAGRPLVALHGAGADAEQLDPLFAALGQAWHGFAPQAARSCNPLLGGGNRWGDYGGYRWFLETADGRPEPATFGDSLLQLQCFLREVLAPVAKASPIVFGHEQGGVLALALALTLPEAVGGIVALHAALPDVPGWALPTPLLDGMPVVLLSEEGIDETACVFEAIGADVTVRSAPATLLETAACVAALNEI